MRKPTQQLAGQFRSPYFLVVRARVNSNREELEPKNQAAESACATAFPQCSLSLFADYKRTMRLNRTTYRQTFLTCAAVLLAMHGNLVSGSVSAFAQEQSAVVPDIALVGNVREALAKNDFASAKKGLENKSDEKLSAAFQVFIHVLESQEKLRASGGVADKNAMQGYLDSMKTLSTDLQAAVSANSVDDKRNFYADYTIAITAITHFACVEEYYSFAGGHFSNVPKAVRDKIFDENLFALRLFSSSLANCLDVRPDDPDSLLLQGVFQLKGENAAGLITINRALDLKPLDFYALLFAVKNWNNPLIVRNIDSLKKFVSVMRESRLKSIRVFEIAENKHSMEYRILSDDFAASGATGFPSQMLLDLRNDSNQAKLNCEQMVKVFQEELAAEKK